jgi:hypothetical protein
MVLGMRYGRSGCIALLARARTVCITITAMVSLVAVGSCTPNRHNDAQPFASHSSGSSAPNTTTTPAQAALNRSTDGVFVPWLPIQLRSFTLADARILNAARFKAEASCVRSFDLPFPEVSVAPLGQRQIAFQQNRRYGITDRAEASQFGYHVDPSLAGGDRGTPLIQQLDDSQKTVLYNSARGTSFHGKPLAPDGCLGVATQSIAPSAEYAHSEIGASIAQDGFVRSKNDPRVTAAFAQWSHCMAAHGYDYPDPITAGADPRWTGSQVTHSEVTAALTDIDCKTTTNLISTWSKVEAEIETTMIAQNKAAVASSEAALQAQLARAEQILAGR